MPMKSLFCWSNYESDDEKSREIPTPKNLLVAFTIFIMSPYLLLKSQVLRVKRGNLILPAGCCADNTLKIIDFGISAHFEVEQRPGFTMGHGELSGWNPIRRWRFHPQREGRSPAKSALNKHDQKQGRGGLTHTHNMGHGSLTDVPSPTGWLM